MIVQIHTFRQLAHIEYMGGLFFFAAVLLGVAAILFFPIYVETDAHYDMNRRKLTFGVYAYKFLRVAGGYIATYTGGLAVHLSEKKASLIPYAQLNSERKRFSIMRTFKLKSLKLTTETGVEYLMPIALAHTVIRTYFHIKGGEKESIRNNLWLTDGDILRVSLQFTVYFNLFILLKNLFKALKEKMKVLCQTKMKSSTT